MNLFVKIYFFRINGLLWTAECDEINKHVSKTSLNGEEFNPESFLYYVEKNILTVSSIVDIKSILEVNDEEAKEIHELVMKHQIDLNIKIEDLQLPSLECNMTLKVEELSKGNISKCEEFLQFCKTELMALSEEEKHFMLTLDWLNNIGKKIKIDLLTSEAMLHMKTDDMEIIFIMDDTLRDYLQKYDITVGLYHYSLRLANPHKVILRRMKLFESFTQPYNTMLLKAFDGRIQILPVFSNNEWLEFNDKYQCTVPNLQETNISHLMNSHKIVPLTEFFAMSDQKKFKDIFSATTEFISTYPTMKSSFRKVPLPSEATYLLPGKGHFELLSNNVLRFKNRLNAEDLLLVELVLWYDLLPKSDSKELFEIYKDKLKKIPKGDVIGIHGSTFPTHILCSNSQVMKLRRSRKVLKTPFFQPETDEYKYSKILLFFPLKPNFEIEMERIGIFTFTNICN